MIHTLVGNIGHLSVIISFIFALFAAVFYALSTRSHSLQKQKEWNQNARVSFYIHGIAVLGVIGSLFFIIYNNYYEYHYAWAHSSSNLPTHFMISCFWEGQEGSFLLWSFWHVVIGVILINTNKKWEAPMMVVFMLVQAFLSSMILGAVFLEDLKIGSSPFVLLRDALDAPIFATDPNFVPEDGTGLNPLLQNYWMVIHPPVLFLGFALTLVPFSYLIAGLWKKEYTSWIRPALPWTIVASAILGIGIMMGAYWAYETLNFGGYWNWDPVENAVYIPWLILIAAIHTMINYRKNKSGLKTTMILVIAGFILILYSTFLTRSGILGESSVHSFTDLGLSGQLLVYLLAFLLISIVLLWIRWKSIPTTQKEISTYSSDFWIFLGVTVLCLMAFQVFVPTSIPVFNAILEGIGIESNMAPPADQVIYYSKFQIWFGIALAILSGTGQFFWWKKQNKSTIKDTFGMPLVITLVLSTILVGISGLNKISYILLFTAGIYAIVANGQIVLEFLRYKRNKLSGGSIAHLGIAMILVGILFSSGFSTVVSQNTTGKLYSREFSDEMNQNNVLLWLNDPVKMAEYELLYKGARVEIKNVPDYVPKENVFVLQDGYHAIVLDTIAQSGKTYYLPGDTANVYSENTYYEVDFIREDGKTFTLFPRAQVNPNMGLIASPDIKVKLNKDLYTHVSSIPDPEQEIEWSEMQEHEVQMGEQFFVEDFVAVLESVHRTEDVANVQLDSGDVAIKAHIKIMGKNQNYLAEPIYLIKDRMVGRVPDYVKDLGFKFSFLHVHPETNSFTVGLQTTQRDYIILKAMEKPWINILWTGTLVLIVGFTMAAYRRYKEYSFRAS